MIPELNQVITSVFPPREHRRAKVLARIPQPWLRLNDSYKKGRRHWIDRANGRRCPSERCSKAVRRWWITALSGASAEGELFIHLCHITFSADTSASVLGAYCCLFYPWSCAFQTSASICGGSKVFVQWTNTLVAYFFRIWEMCTVYECVNMRQYYKVL